MLPDDGLRHELIDGEHHVSPAPRPAATRGSSGIWSPRLRQVSYRPNPVGLAFMAPLDAVLSNVDVVEPDLLYVARERVEEVVTDTHVAGAPDLAVEIVSASSRKRDETTKRHLFDRYGVGGYRVIDPELQIQVFRRREGRLSKLEELAARLATC